MFQTDELVVYPAQGVGRIESINHQEVGGALCEFYIVRIIANNITLMIPVNNALNVGLRSVISTTEAKEILELLCKDEDVTIHTGQNWNRRHREYTEKLKSVDLKEVALVVRELLLIGKSKELSFGERRLLEQAMLLITGEIAEALNIDEASLRDEIMSYYPPPPVKN